MWILRSALLVIAASFAISACATTAVPRPYPGMAAPSSADAGRVPASAAAPADAAETGGADATTPVSAVPPRSPADAAVDAAEGLLGTPYRNGGADPAGFDCSGFVQYVYARAGTALPRSVREQWNAGRPVESGDVRRGDLVFFAIGGREVSHVGIALDGQTFVHAPSANGAVRVERSTSPYWAQRYVGARRIAEDEDYFWR